MSGDTGITSSATLPLGGWCDHTTVTMAVQRIYIASVIENRRHRAGVNTAYMVNLRVGFHGNLPVTVEIEHVAGRKTAVLKLKFLPFIGNWAKPIKQDGGLWIKIYENEGSRSARNEPT